MVLDSVSPRAKLWIAAALCLLAALVPPRGLAICLGEAHADGRTAWGVTGGGDHCPCDHEDSRPDSDEDGGDGEHRDLEVPALAELTRSDVGTRSLGRFLEGGVLAAAVHVDPLFSLAGPTRADRSWRLPPRRVAVRCQRAVVLRI